MKKSLRALKNTTIALLSIIIVFVLYFYISNKLFLGFKSKDNTDYLKMNMVQIKDSISSELFDEDFYNSNVFLFGEFHGYADNQILDKELFLFLNKKLGIRYYIAEMDSTTAKKLNAFLSSKTKDEAILKDVVLTIGKRIPQQSSLDLLEKWSAIYDYNQKLKDSLKIKIIGIYAGFDADSSKISRDSEMIVNLKNSIKALGIENQKFYGFFGYFHTLQNNVESGSKPFAAYLKEAGYKPTSFVSYTIDSEMYLPKNPEIPTPPEEKLNWGNADGPIMLVKGIGDLKALSKPNTITLFKLNSMNSPYFESQNLIWVKSKMFEDNIFPVEDANTTDYFQYAFLLRNSKALTKLK